jgi:hypothetical protein
MATIGGNGPTIRKGDGGRPGMVQLQSHDRERDDDDSPTMTMNGAFGISPILSYLKGVCGQPSDDAIDIADRTR